MVAQPVTAPTAYFSSLALPTVGDSLFLSPSCSSSPLVGFPLGEQTSLSPKIEKNSTSTSCLKVQIIQMPEMHSPPTFKK